MNLIGAFIPPIEEDIVPLKKSTESDLNGFLKKHKNVYATNASDLVYDNFNNEIYMGLDLVNFFKNNKNIALIFSSPTAKYYNYLKQKFKELPNNVFFIKEDHDFVNIIKRTDGLIRATTTDGDSLSIKEGLYYKKNVYATSSVDRHEDVILFSDFSELSEILKKKKVEIINSVKDNSFEIFKIYKKLLN